MKTTSILWRLILGTVTLAVLTGLIGLYAIRSNRQIAGTFSTAAHFQTITTAASEASSYAKRAEGHLMLYLTLGDPADRAKFSQRLISLEQQINVIEKNVNDTDARAHLSVIKTNSDLLGATGRALLASFDKSMNETGTFDFKANEDDMQQLDSIASAIRQEALDLTTHEINLEDSAKDSAVAQLNLVNRNLLLLVSAFFLLALVVAYVISASIWRPVARLREAVYKVGQGDLDVAIEVKARDEIGALAGAFNDMTGQLRTRLEERNRAEEELCNSEARFRVIFMEAHDGISLVDAETGRIVDCNPEYERQTGRPVSQLRTLKVWELSPLDSVEHTQDLRDTYKAREGVSPAETVYRKPDGTTSPIEFISKALDIRGKKYLLILTHDLTERRKMQEKLIAQDRLVSIGQLVSGIAHELNNPLTSVIGFSELLLRSELPAQVKADIEIICSEAKRSAAIVKNLLTFARQQSQEKQKIDVNAPVLMVLRMREQQQRVTNIKVETRLAVGLPQIMANISQLQQVFFNVVINAEQAMLAANRKGILSIRSERRGDFVRVSFTDDGPGISREHMVRVFSPFFTTKETGQGTGLGLSISQGIIAEHAGKMWAESDPGEGATFIVELPVYREDDGSNV